jgi:hypothetical protein
MALREMKQVDAIQPNREHLPSQSRNFKNGEYTYPIWPESFDESLYAKPRPIPKIITAEFDRRSSLTAMLRDKHGIVEGRRLPGSDNPSPEVTAFVLFFVTFSNTIGKEWTSLEKEHKVMEGNMLDEYSDVESTSSDGPWKPKVNPEWMDGEFFQTLHSTLRPTPENVVFDGPSTDLCPPDCANICGGKIIDLAASTYLGTPWARHDNVAPIQTDSLPYVRSPSEEAKDNEIEKAGAIARAQIDMGYNTVSVLISPLADFIVSECPPIF